MHAYSVLDIAVAGDNSRFASVGGDRQVYLWDVEQGTTVRRWSGHSSRVEAVQFAGEGDSVVVSGMLATPNQRAFSPVGTWSDCPLDIQAVPIRQ